MMSIIGLCERALWLSEGKIERIGDATEVVGAYYDSLAAEQQAIRAASSGSKF